MNSKKNKKQLYSQYLSNMCLMQYWGEGVVWVDVKFDDCRHKLIKAHNREFDTNNFLKNIFTKSPERLTQLW